MNCKKQCDKCEYHTYDFSNGETTCIKDTCKHETIIVRYGTKSGMKGGKYGILYNGDLVSYDRTFKKQETAEAKALEFAQRMHKDFYQDCNNTFYHFEFVKEGL